MVRRWRRSPVGTSVYGSNGNSLPSPPPEFLQELRVNTSMYDAQQGATSGAQIDANTKTGTNNWHGQMYGRFANNALNAAPFFFNQQYQLSTQGIGAFPQSMANPALHRWTRAPSFGGPALKEQNILLPRLSSIATTPTRRTGLSQMTVPSGLTDDRSAAGLERGHQLEQRHGLHQGHRPHRRCAHECQTAQWKLSHPFGSDLGAPIIMACPTST